MSEIIISPGEGLDAPVATLAENFARLSFVENGSNGGYSCSGHLYKNRVEEGIFSVERGLLAV